MNDSRIPIHADAFCMWHNKVVQEDGQCEECKEPPLEEQLPDPFDSVLGG